MRYFLIVTLSLFLASHSIAQSNPYILKYSETVHELSDHISILEDSLAAFNALEDVTNRQFLQKPNVPSFTPQSRTYYWAKFTLENQFPLAERQEEWILLFSSAWTDIDLYVQSKNGQITKYKNGFFIPDRHKDFVPSKEGSFFKLQLFPQEIATIYFRGIVERKGISPDFAIKLQSTVNFYEQVLKEKRNNALFWGFLLMMILYSLVFYFFGRHQSAIFYAIYLLMILLFSAYLSGDLEDWLKPTLFPEQPKYIILTKVVIYFTLMSYLAFVNSFLDLKKLLKNWSKLFQFLIIVGAVLLLVDLGLLFLYDFRLVTDHFTNFPYTILYILISIVLLYPLYKTGDRKAYFVIVGIFFANLGIVLSLLSQVNFISYNVAFFRGGIILEVFVFSLGLAYRQRETETAKQLTDFELERSKMLQQQKQNEAAQLKEMDELKTQFYNNITHEFRTPLTVILGMSDQKVDEKARQLIHRNGKNLLHLVNQLLDLSKLNSGKLELELINGNIVTYLEYLTESFYSMANDKGIRLSFHSEEESLQMDYDEIKIQHIVYNLLSNAIKFTEKGGKIIFLLFKEKEQLKIKVKDTGIGIPSDQLSHIFDRFYQVEIATNKQQAGTGIGLTLTKELVELMKGFIEVKSEVGKGTEFTIWLPIINEKIERTNNGISRIWKKEVNAFAKEKSSYSSLPPSYSLSQLLIIEDNRDVVTYIQRLLEKDYQIHIANDGQSGIEKALAIIPDIIISDVMMPEKNGYEVCEILKQDERTSHIPIILLTAKASTSDRIEGLQYGADAYLTKPFNKKELFVRLEHLVNLRKQLQAKYTQNKSNALGKSDTLTLEDIFFQKVQSEIEANLDDSNFGVAELARAMNLSQVQLYRKIKALTNKNSSQYIRHLRLTKAKQLLKNETLSISEIAYEVGFSDPSYFSRAFQQEFGKSPSDFRI